MSTLHCVIVGDPDSRAYEADLSVEVVRDYDVLQDVKEMAADLEHKIARVTGAGAGIGAFDDRYDIATVWPTVACFGSRRSTSGWLSTASGSESSACSGPTNEKAG